MNAAVGVALAGARGHVSSRDCVTVDGKVYCEVRKEQPSPAMMTPKDEGFYGPILVGAMLVFAVFVICLMAFEDDAQAKRKGHP